ncbi:MAG: gluconate 2-dehydrogenase subunit 3 family protein [Gemmatimonadaceae bacterium]
MERRDLLRVFGAATALSFLPVPHEAAEAWARVASNLGLADGLTDAQLAFVGAIADTIIPRTDTPGATDVNVPAFVNVMVAEYYSNTERTAFVSGLDAIDAHVKARGAGAFADLDQTRRGPAIESIESLSDRRAEPARTYWRLKDLVVYGYFTSEPVMKDVLKNEVIPGKFDGAAPMPKKSSQPAGSGAAHV